MVKLYKMHRIPQIKRKLLRFSSLKTIPKIRQLLKKLFLKKPHMKRKKLLKQENKHLNIKNKIKISYQNLKNKVLLMSGETMTNQHKINT
jgi:hypothetical protein